MTPPALAVEGLAVRYGEVTAVVDVSFVAAAGAVTTVLGRNGAGKTTTVSVCAGLRRPDAGTVTVLGHPAGDAALRAEVGVMPQAAGSGAAGIYPAARAGEVLALVAAMYARPLPTGPLLERLELTRAARTPWRRLSGGEQQRLSLALAIVGRPRLVFLDEPTAGLDVAARHVTWDLISDLRAAGVSVVLTTHAMDEAERLSDHVVVLDAGRVVAAGTPATLTAGGSGTLTFDAPPGLDVAALAGAVPGVSSAVEGPVGHYTLSGDIGPASVAGVTSWLAARDLIPQRLTAGARSLEDVFLALTGGSGR